MDGMKQLSFHIFGIDVYIHTNSVEFLDVFSANYSRFLANPPLGVGDPLVFKIMEASREGSSQSVLLFEGNEHWLPKPEMAGSHFTGRIFYEIQQRLTSHILIHAGVVSLAGQGIVLAADSGHGKSTLVIELTRRGYAFLSDEMAAIHRGDGRVYPFPRSLRVLPESLERLGLALPPDSLEWLGKYTVDIEALFPGSMGEAVPIRHVIILKGPVPDQETSASNGFEEMWFYLGTCTPEFLSDLESLENINNLTCESDHYGVKISLNTDQRSGILGQARALARRHHLTWLSSDMLTYGQADFSQSAQLAPLSPSQAAMRLLNYFQGTHQSALLGNSSVSRSAPIFAELAALISKADCHLMRVGPLNQIVELIEKLPMDGKA